MPLFKKLFNKKRDNAQTNTDKQKLEEFYVDESIQIKTLKENAITSSDNTEKINTPIVKKQKALIPDITHEDMKPFPSTSSELNKPELFLLKEMKYTKIENKPYIPSYLIYEYGMNSEDASKYLKLFLKLNLLEKCSLDETIKKHTINEIKEVLQTKSITVKGKKIDYINALYNNFATNKLKELFPPKYYVLSKSGEILLNEQLDADDWENRYEKIDFEEAKKAINLLIESKAYKNTILYTNNPFHDIPEYVLKNHEVFICTVIYSDSWKKSKRILRRLFQIEDTQFYVEKYKSVIRSEKELKNSKESAEFIENGYKEYYEICSVEDESMCEHCKKLNGKWFPVSKARIGINFPPFVNCSSEYCRCFAAFEIKKLNNK